MPPEHAVPIAQSLIVETAFWMRVKFAILATFGGRVLDVLPPARVNVVMLACRRVRNVIMESLTQSTPMIKMQPTKQPAV